MCIMITFLQIRVCDRPLEDGGAGGAAAPREIFSGGFAMLFYSNNNDTLCLFYAACVFNFFQFLCPIFCTTNINLKFPNSIYASGNGSTKLKYYSKYIWPVGHLGNVLWGRCRRVKYGPAARLKWNNKGRGADKVVKTNCLFRKVIFSKSEKFPLNLTV